MKIYKIGLDDTDSSLGYCTTFVAVLLLEKVIEENYEIPEFPYLIRLNPNIPYKTRGNAAIAIHVKCEESFMEELVKTFEKLTRNIVDKNRIDKPDPSLAYCEINKCFKLRNFYEKCLVKEVSLEEAISLAERIGVRYVSSKRGLIGSMAALGAYLEDFTYELLAYRDPKDKDKQRPITYQEVERLDSRFKDWTFANIDREKRRILITPHGKDPVLVGIRGIDPDMLVAAFESLNLRVDRWAIFKTNQATDVHLKISEKYRSYSRYSVFYEEIRLIDKPKLINGGHIILKGISAGEKPVEVAIYKESGIMNEKARFLVRGDVIKVGGGIKEIVNDILRVNAERLEIIELKEIKEKIPLRCPECGTGLKKEGAGKGMSCNSCGFKIPFEFELLRKTERPLKKGEILLPPPRSRRHLTRPIELTNKSKDVRFSLSYFYSSKLFKKNAIVYPL